MLRGNILDEALKASKSLDKSTNAAVVQKAFGFPFEPYFIQADLMRNIDDALEASLLQSCRLLLCESPTGTGKTLSLLCSTMRWLLRQPPYVLRDDPVLEQLAAVQEEESTKSTEPEWVKEHSAKRAHERLKKWQEQQTEAEQRRQQLSNRERRLKKKASQTLEEDEKDLDDVDTKCDAAALRVKALLSELGEFNDGLGEEEPEPLKVFFCSRTHSQLTQCIHELRRTVYGDRIRAIAIGSRQNLCIHPKVRDLPSQTKINDACRLLQQGKWKNSSESECPFYTKASRDMMLDVFRDRSLAVIRDIEDLVDLGNQTKLCSYYGARYAMKSAQFVTLPYNLLFQKSSRDSLGIDLRGHIVVIDEAHNLIDALAQMHSVTVPVLTLLQAAEQLNAYHARYANRLAPNNLTSLQDLLRLVNGLGEYVTRTKDRGDHLLTVNALLLEMKCDDVNLFRLGSTLRQNQLIRKLQGFALTTQQEQETSSSSIQSIMDFMDALTHSNEDGRVIVTHDDSEQKRPVLKYILLNVSKCFEPVLQEARLVILAGGTMSPMDAMIRDLAPKLKANQVRTFSCGHVIQPDHLMGLVLMSGAAGSPQWRFTHVSRNDPALMTGFGETLCTLLTFIPEGVVLFVPSYSYQNQLVQQWRSSGVLQQIEKYKKIFYERPDQSSDRLLLQYKQHIELCQSNKLHQSGALLISVVGGKLSEGINFSDHLGRAVFMLGLPYPNVKSPDLAERLAHIGRSAGEDLQKARTLQADYYDLLCMRAVNQSIGRAIRHVHDYAVIILCDARYAQPRIQSRLPGWIQSRVQRAENVHEASSAVERFFQKFES